MKTKMVVAALVASTLLGGAAQAAIVAGATINGIATFKDTNTGLNWARLDTYFNQTHNFMAADVTSKGFTVATTTTLNTLLSTLPLNGGQWGSYAAIMGKAPNRDLIWGSIAPVNTSGNIDWWYAFNGNISWQSAANVHPANAVPNVNSEVADMNIWAYTDGGGEVVPEPASWAMMIAGFGLVGAAMRRRALAAA
jgi:PEP-CTERM motif